MLVSDSTHIPPTGMKRPSATCPLIRSHSPGYSSRIQAYCWAEEQEKFSCS